MALIRVLLAEVDREIVALPMSRVVAAVELTPGKPVEGVDHALGFAPLHSLSGLLGWSQRPRHSARPRCWCSAMARALQRDPRGDGLVALQIDRLIGQQEAVVKAVSPATGPVARSLARHAARAADSPCLSSTCLVCWAARLRDTDGSRPTLKTAAHACAAIDELTVEGDATERLRDAAAVRGARLTPRSTITVLCGSGFPEVIFCSGQVASPVAGPSRGPCSLAAAPSW